jgi:hypothetical protein
LSWPANFFKSRKFLTYEKFVDEGTINAAIVIGKLQAVYYYKFSLWNPQFYSKITKRRIFVKKAGVFTKREEYSEIFSS